MGRNLNILKYVAFAMLAASIALITIGVYFYIEKNKQLAEYKLIKCKIINIDEPERGNAELTFRDLSSRYPPFRYSVYYDESEHELDYKLNEIYEVYYNEKDVKKSEIKDFLINYETAFILLIIGIAFLIDVPILLFVTYLRKKKFTESSSEHYGIKDSVISE